MRVLGVIPARPASPRLPNKPLQPLAGEPLITRVIERVLEHGLIGELVVATDSPRVVEVAERSLDLAPRVSSQALMHKTHFVNPVPPSLL